MQNDAHSRQPLAKFHQYRHYWRLQSSDPPRQTLQFHVSCQATPLQNSECHKHCSISMKVTGSNIHESKDLIAPKCEKYLASIKRKKKIDLESIGSPPNNILLDLLRCQCKAKKTCKDVEKLYSKCHSSVMGTGSFGGRKNCAEELENLYRCAMGRWRDGVISVYFYFHFVEIGMRICTMILNYCKLPIVDFLK